MKAFSFILMVALFAVTTAKPFLDWKDFEDFEDNAPVATTAAPPNPPKTTTEAPPQTTVATTEAPTQTTEAPTKNPKESQWIKDIEKIVMKAKKRIENGEDEDEVFEWAKELIVEIMLREFEVEELKEKIKKIHKEFEEKIAKEMKKFKKNAHQKGKRIMKKLKAALKKHGLEKFLEWIEEAEKKAENKAGHEANNEEGEGGEYEDEEEGKNEFQEYNVYA